MSASIRSPSRSRLPRAWTGFALLVALVFAPLQSQAQTRSPGPRIGFLTFFSPPPVLQSDSLDVGLRQGLSELGLVEGQSVTVERRYAGFQPDRLAAMASELVRLKVDVIFAAGQPAREAARKATSTIPIVTMGGSDPVRAGWAKSLARPGGNITGLTFTFPELDSKRLELLKEALPGLERVAVLLEPTEVIDAADVVREIETGARRLGLQIQVIEVHASRDIETAFESARRGRAQAVLTIAMFAHRAQVASFARKDRLVSMGESLPESAEGFTLAYGPDIADLGRRCALKIGKILKGEPVGEMPIERPAKFRLIINLKSANALGVSVPQSLQLRADEIIQ